PQVLLCDEALEGFDAPSAFAAKDELRRLAGAGSAVLFSSHVTETVERLCDRVVLLHLGRVARALTRAEWGAGDDLHSPLERVFLDVLGPTVMEGSRCPTAAEVVSFRCSPSSSRPPARPAARPFPRRRRSWRCGTGRTARPCVRSSATWSRWASGRTRRPATA